MLILSKFGAILCRQLLTVKILVDTSPAIFACISVSHLPTLASMDHIMLHMNYEPNNFHQFGNEQSIDLKALLSLSTEDGNRKICEHKTI